MNDYLLISKRATQIIQENNQAINYLNINKAINQAAKELKEKEQNS